MKTFLLSIAVVFMTHTGFSQKSPYFLSLCDAMPGFQNCKTSKDFIELGDKFSGIAASDTTEWLADYYYAQCYIVSSLMEPVGSPQKDKLLDKIEKSVTRITRLVPEESEAWTLLGMYYSARLLVNPPERGYTYIGLSNRALDKAKNLDPTNPRVKLMILKNEIGTSQYFGGPIKEFCNKAQTLLAEWDNYKVKSPVHPQWGKTQAAEIVAGCNL